MRDLSVHPFGTVKLLYVLPLSDVNHKLARVRVFLSLACSAGAILALLAGLFVSGRAMRPIVERTEAAREIERTRTPCNVSPVTEADDEIAELGRTLEGMLGGA